MARTMRGIGILGAAALALTALGCSNVVDDGEGNVASAGDEVRISGRFEVTIPAADAWPGVRDQNAAVAGLQVNVQVHQLSSLLLRWSNHGNERLATYLVITTGEESFAGIPRIVASSGIGEFRAVDGAFVLDGALYLVGNATGGITLSGATRNEKPVVAGIAFNGRVALDALNTAARVEDIRTFTFPAGSAPVVFDTPAFAQRWTDTSNGENFACYNINSTSGQFLTGTSPTDFRTVTGGFVLNGHLYALGEATGGARATPGVPGGYTAIAARRALGHYGTGAAGTRIDFGTTVTSLPSP